MTTNVKTMTIAQLVAVYNALSPRSVKKFSDKGTAIQRVKNLLESGEFVLHDSHDEGCVHDLGFTFIFSKGTKQPKKGHTEYSDNLRIELRVNKNPKRKGSKANKRFALYVDGMTVAEYKAACVKVEGTDALPGYGYLMDLRWDEPRGFITVWTEELIKELDPKDRKYAPK